MALRLPTGRSTEREFYVALNTACRWEVEM
jgi:hypothetical protein